MYVLILLVVFYISVVCGRKCDSWLWCLGMLVLL